MQALAWSLRYPQRLRHVRGDRHGAESLGRRTSPSTKSRGAPSSPTRTSTAATTPSTASCRKRGLRVARMIGHITYLSDDAMEAKFGRDLQQRRARLLDAGDRVPDRGLPALPGRQVQRVLRRQHLPADHAGARLLRPGARARRRPDREPSRGRRCRFELVSFTTDWRFAPARSREIVKALVDNRRDVSYAEIDAPHGHDAFLLDDPRYHGVMRACFANLVGRSRREAGPPPGRSRGGPRSLGGSAGAQRQAWGSSS